MEELKVLNTSGRVLSSLKNVLCLKILESLESFKELWKALIKFFRDLIISPEEGLEDL